MRLLWVLPAVMVLVLLALGGAEGQYDVMVEGPGTGGAWGFPGENTTHSYRIWNTGALADTYDLTAVSQGSWSTYIQPQITLSAGESQWIDVTVSVPHGTLAYTADDLTVRADSRGSTVFDRNFSVTRVYRTADVDVDSLGSPNGVPGENLTLTFQVTNQGNAGDNFTLDSGARDSAFRNWTTLSAGHTSDVEAYTGQLIGVQVNIPRSTSSDIIAANTYADIWLSARSQWNPVVESSGYSRIRVSESRDVDLGVLGNDTFEVDAGETAAFTLIVTNVANFDSDDVFDLTWDTTQTDWLIVIQPNNISLSNGESQKIVLRATPPDFTDFRRCEITVTATSRADQTKSRSVNIVALLPQIFGVEVTALPPTRLEGGPLDVVSYMFEVENRGNDIDLMTFNAWTDWGMTTEVIGTLEIPFRGVVEIPVNVTVSGIEAGQIEVVHLLVLAGDGVTQDQATTTLEVLQGYAVSLDPETNVTDADPGAEIRMNVLVTNLGNGYDEYDIKIFSNYSHRSSLASPLPLRAGETVTLSIDIDVPSGESAGTLETTYVNVTSRNDASASAESRAIVNVAQMAGVQVGNAPAASGDPGGMTTLNFTVTNTGNGVDSFVLEASSERGWALTVVNHGATEQIEANGTRYVQVRVLIPHGLDAGTSDLVTLMATSEFGKDVTDKGNGVCTVDLVSGVNIDSRDADAMVIPGYTIGVPIYVRNTGNGHEYIRLEAVASGGWSADVDRGTLSLERNESQVVEVSINAPIGSLGGSSTVTVTAVVILENATGDLDSVYLQAEASFAMPSDRSFMYIFPGETRSFSMRIANLWSSSSSLNVSFSPPHGWTVNITGVPSSAQPGQSISIIAMVTAPANLLHLFYPTIIPVTFGLDSLGQSATVDMTLIGLSPDMSIEGLRFDSDIGERETLRISFTILSRAAPTGDPEYDLLSDVPVEVYLDGELLETIVVDVPIDGQVPVVIDLEVPDLDWWLRHESAVLDVKVASRDYESQSTMNDNIASRSLSLRKRPHPLVLIALPIIAVSSMAAMRVSRRKVRLRQRMYDHVLVGAAFSSVLALLIVLPIASYPLDMSGELLSYSMLVAIIPAFCIAAGLRTKSYIAVAALAGLMFGTFFVAMASGHGTDIAGDIVANAGSLHIPTFLFLVVPLIIGMVAVRSMMRLLDSALAAYTQAKALVDAVKQEAR